MLCGTASFGKTTLFRKMLVLCKASYGKTTLFGKRVCRVVKTGLGKTTLYWKRRVLCQR